MKTIQICTLVEKSTVVLRHEVTIAPFTRKKACVLEDGQAYVLIGDEEIRYEWNEYLEEESV